MALFAGRNLMLTLHYLDEYMCFTLFVYSKILISLPNSCAFLLRDLDVELGNDCTVYNFACGNISVNNWNLHN